MGVIAEATDWGESADEMHRENDGEAWDEAPRRWGSPFAIPGRTGVQTATLNTPAGAATLRLPEQVVTQAAFKDATQRLERAINGLRDQVTSTRSELLAKQAILQKEAKASIAKQRKSNQSQAMMAMMVTMMTQRDAQQRLDGHRHLDAGKPVDPATVPSSDNTMLMMLPMLAMGDDAKEDGKSSDSGGNNMMMMVMMMALMGRR